MRQILLVFSLLIISPVFLLGQIPTPGQVQQELGNRGLDQEEVRRRLLLKGINVDAVNPTDPGQVAEVEAAIQQVVAEMEQEKKEGAADKIEIDPNNPKKIEEKPVIVPPEEPKKNKELKDEDLGEVLKDGTKSIEEAVEEGATLEEAVAEQVADAIEEKLPPAKTWGQEIFRNKSIALYRQSEDVKPPDSYILGVGDAITIAIWGYSQEYITFEINSEGYIKPQKMPRIPLKGMTLGKAKNLLRNRFAQYYRFRPEEFELTLNFSRTITINIVGEVFNFGSYTIPAINTAFNALVAAGGPTNIGSVRQIKLYRAGEKEKNIDIYKFLLDPAAQEELFLRENDFIHVPIAERLVTIKGAVNRPNTYELIGKENLIDLIKYAGGLTDVAYLGSIQVQRIGKDKEEILDVSLTELRNQNSDFELKPSDVITVKEINKGVENYIDISGTVEFPDRYSYENGMRITDLLEKAVLKPEARKDIAYLQRTNLDGTVQYIKVNLDSILSNNRLNSNLLLKPKDKVIIYSLEQFVQKSTISIGGSVVDPGTFPYDLDDSLMISDLILLGGGLKPNAADYAFIERTNPSNKKEKSYIRVNLKNLEDEENAYLRPFDKLTIFAKESFSDTYTVQINGAVRDPKDFDFVDGIKVRDLVFQSKGLLPEAKSQAYIYRTDPTNKKIKEYLKIDIKNAVLNPNSSDNLELKPGDKVNVYSALGFTDAYKVDIKGAVRKGGSFSYDSGLRFSDLVYFSNGLTPDATNFAYISRTDPKNTKAVEYLKVDIDKALQDPGSQWDLSLEPLDQIEVFSKLTFIDETFVKVGGAVRTPGKYKYDSSLSLSDIITMAGGVKLQAAKNRVDIFRIEFEENRPTKTIAHQIEIDENFEIISPGKVDFTLEPFDQIVVREVPDFEFQKVITIEGEVNYPGEYATLNEDEPLSSLINRSGGPTDFAFLEGATLYRPNGGVGYIVIDLKRALRNPSFSRWNIILEDGDVVMVPKKKDIVTIVGATHAGDLYQEKILNNTGKINVPYKRWRRANYFIRKHAGGIGDKGGKKYVSVEHPNGEVKKTINFGLFKLTPKVRKGSVITAGYKPAEPELELAKEKEPTDWGEVLTSTIAQATSILTLILLLQRLD